MFWSDKTEAPTPKRREDARKQGLVPRSGELTGAVVVLVGLLAAGSMVPAWWRHLLNGLAGLFGGVGSGGLAPLVHTTLLMTVAFLVAVMGAALLCGLVQTRFLFTLYPLRWDWQKVNPLAGLRRMVSGMAVWDAVRHTLKAALIAAIGFTTVQGHLGTILSSGAGDVVTSAATLGQVTVAVLWRCLAAVLALAAVDYAVQWWRVERSLRMTRQEVKDELKQTEGDPAVKARLRQRYRQLVLHRQIHRVREATVVVTNPTHYAVALRYDPKTLPAPQVIAKGTEWLAHRIVHEAQRHGVPVVPNAPLAQALMKVPLGAFIPPELYQAAAEVLAYVFRITGRAKEVLGEA